MKSQIVCKFLREAFSNHFLIPILVELMVLPSVHPSKVSYVSCFFLCVFLIDYELP